MIIREGTRAEERGIELMIESSFQILSYSLLHNAIPKLFELHQASSKNVMTTNPTRRERKRN
jgi:hypothetical protein